MSRGYFGVAAYQPKTESNIGVLWRSAHAYGAAFVATVGRRYEHVQASDTPNVRRHTPLWHFRDIDDLVGHLPHGCRLVAVELDPRAVALPEYRHPQRALYLLGAEDNGLPATVIGRCHDLVVIPTVAPYSINLAAAGSIVLSHRHMSGRPGVAVEGASCA